MHCMRCGVEIEDTAVFCDKCGENMERDPVKANVTVQLPARPEQAPAKKKSRRMKYTKPEEQVRHLRRVLRWVWLVLIVALLAFAVTAAMLMRLLRNRDEGFDFDIGQNYGTMETGVLD